MYSISRQWLIIAALVLLSGAESAAIAGGGTRNTAQGGTVGFGSLERTRMDNSRGYIDSIGLYGYDGGPLKALQFRVRNLNGRIRITGVELDPLLKSDPRWLCMTNIQRSTVLPDLSTNDTFSVVILGQDDAVLDPAALHGLIRFTYDAVDVTDPGPHETRLEIFDVVGSLVGGTDAGLAAGGMQTIVLRNTVEKADVNFDDEVNINDLLSMMHVILGKATFQGDALLRADIAPWPSGDESIDVKDLAMTQQVILEGQYPNGIQLSAPVENVRSAAKRTDVQAQAKITVYVTKRGVVVRMENTVNVKGIQLELSNIPTVPDTAKVNTIWGPGSKGYSSNVLRIIAADLSSGSIVSPGNRLVIEMAFDIANPLQVSFKKLIVAKEDNSPVTDVEASIVYGSPNPAEQAPELPRYELCQNYPNPFNPSTRIQFNLPSAGNVRLVVYNQLGEEISTLFSGYAEAGRHTVEWNARSGAGERLASGVYVYTLYTARTRFSRKMIYTQ